MRALLAVTLTAVALGATACASPQEPATRTAATGPVPADARQIAREAFIYGFPMVVNYRTMHKQAIDTTNREYRAPFNVLARTKGVATSDDRFVVTPNSDTPYSFLWMDLRAEPMVVTVPKVEKGRYYTGQLVDLYTFNFAYLGSRAFGNDGGEFLIAGPGWTGETPKGIKAVMRSETEFAYLLFRTQLFNAADLANVTRIQAGYDARPLSKYQGTATPPAAPVPSWPAISDNMDKGAAVFKYMNFMLQFCPTHPSEVALMQRFATLGIGAGKTFDLEQLSPETRQAVLDGIADAGNDMAEHMKKVNAGQVKSSSSFGTREFLKNDYMLRFAGARLGLYGNSGEEAIYLPYFVDAMNEPADASKHRYTMTFAKGQLPPAHAFWSITMYDGNSQFLVANPLNRYLLNSTTLESYKYGPDGSLTLYLQKESPGAEKEANWLPAPDGPFYAVLRVYMPDTTVIDGTWKEPPLVPVD